MSKLNIPISQKIKLGIVSKSDYRFLFTLLQERDPRANISHKQMPTYDEHVKFLQSKPYSKWYIIFFNNKKVGSIYLSNQDEIGIFLQKEFQHSGIGKLSMDLLMKKNPRSRYLANVNPKNSKSKQFFKKNGFSLIQHTYELIPNRIK
mgnify:FL=1|jgi:RimJ/RimL family protein N-acetyltransferase